MHALLRIRRHLVSRCGIAKNWEMDGFVISWFECQLLMLEDMNGCLNWNATESALSWPAWCKLQGAWEVWSQFMLEAALRFQWRISWTLGTRKVIPLILSPRFRQFIYHSLFYGWPWLVFKDLLPATVSYLLEYFLYYLQRHFWRWIACIWGRCWWAFALRVGFWSTCLFTSECPLEDNCLNGSNLTPSDSLVATKCSPHTGISVFIIWIEHTKCHLVWLWRKCLCSWLCFICAKEVEHQVGFVIAILLKVFVHPLANSSVTDVWHMGLCFDLL